MSTSENKNLPNEQFVRRLTELCGSDKPADLARQLEISYQASKNYLEGRLPDTQTIINISEKTGCSIDWLLSGYGKKFREYNLSQGTVIPFDQLRALIREECEKVIAEKLNQKTEIAEGKVIVLEEEDIEEEKVMDENSHSSFKNPVRHK